MKKIWKLFKKKNQKFYNVKINLKFKSFSQKHHTSLYVYITSHNNKLFVNNNVTYIYMSSIAYFTVSFIYENHNLLLYTALINVKYSTCYAIQRR